MAERDSLETEKELKKERRFLRNVMATIPDSLLILDRKLLIKTANRSFYKLFQVKPKKITGIKITDMLGDGDGKLGAKLVALRGTKDKVENFELHYQSEKLGERIFNITARGIIVAEEEEEEEEEEELVVIRDITERRRAMEIAEVRTFLLESITTATSLHKLLDGAMRKLESMNPRMLCSVLLLDDKQQCLRHGAAPSLPDFFNKVTDGLKIGYGVGSCGHAAFTGKLTIVSDTSTHPFWEPYRALARTAGLGSCWSQPIPSSNAEVLGTFAIYQRTASEPTPDEIKFIEMVGHYLSVAIERKRTEEALRQSEEKYRSLVDNVSLGVFRSTTGPGGRFLEVSKAMEEITGYSRTELLRMDVSSLYVHPEERESVTEEIASARGKITKELNFRKKDGSKIMVADTKTPVRDGAGKLLYFDGVLEDITERKQAEEMLRQSEEKLRLMFESITDSIVVTDLSGKVIECNEGALRMGGYTSGQEVIGRNAFEFIAPSDRSRAIENMERTLEDGYVQNAEYTCLAKDGGEFPVELSSALLKDNTGHGAGFITVTKEITERKRAEDEIRRLLGRESHAAREWQETFDAVADIVMLISPHHELLRVNRAGCEATGKNPEELIGKKCYEVMHGLSAPIKECPCVQALETRRSHTSEFTEQGRHYLLSAYPIFDKDGEIAAFAHIVKDITDARHAEEEKRELELKAYNANRLAAIGEMAAGIAHEINNPLTPILGFTEMIMKRELPEDIKSDLKIIYDSTKRTADVTRRLLTFARQSKPMRTVCGINEVVESTLLLRAYYLKTNNIKVITELTAGLPSTVADAGQLQQVLLNLIMNTEYEMTRSHGGGELLIKTEQMGNIIRISVTDDGPGISEENMEKLFTPFFTTKKVGEGTGLGLSVCHGIVTEHDGRIYAKSEAGKGATFIVELPIVRQQREKKDKPSVSDTVGAGETVKARILVVDDEPTIVQVLKRVLTLEGYEVRTVSKAKEALQMIESEEFALILLDIKLPDMSGIELYQNLDKAGKPSAQRITFITGDVMGADTAEFFSRNGVAFITKPFEIEQIKKEVKRKLLQIE